MSHSPTVIFDMDGVLVDSYRAHFKSWQAVAAEEGLTVSQPDFAAQFGRTSREISFSRSGRLPAPSIPSETTTLAKKLVNGSSEAVQ